jgi:hypothetical protein
MAASVQPHLSPIRGRGAREGVAQVVVTVKLDNPAGPSLHAVCSLPLLQGGGGEGELVRD